MFYTGIGSRKTPEHILKAMNVFAGIAEGYGYTLRSGGAKGADTAFELGVKSQSNKNIYRVSQEFNFNQNMFASKKLEKHVPIPLTKMRPVVRKLLIRNAFQIYGSDVSSPVLSRFLICWTPTVDYTSIEAGGTRYAVLMAQEENIPVYNFSELLEEDYNHNYLIYISNLICGTHKDL